MPEPRAALDLRQVDELVAEHAMGWSVRGSIYESEGRYMGAYRGVAKDEDMLPWSPSQSWDAAGQVVERMRSLGWGIIVGSHETTEFVWWITFVKDGVEHEGQADTFPLAVCLAALSALGVDVPQ